MPLAPLEAARQFLEKIPKPSHILVAISGGSDSTGLLLALHRVLKASGRGDIVLEAVTIDHALRDEAAEEARCVATLCEKLDITHHIRRWDDEKPISGISAAARLARYRLIASVAEEIHADMVVLGHTLDDQMETIAMRTSRSARQDNLGLAGMADAVLYDARLWVLRPFLNVTRQDIRAFLEANGFGWIDDPSNDDVKYERVRVRRKASTLRVEPVQDRATLSALAVQLVETYVQSFSSLVLRLDPAALQVPVPVLRHALSALCAVMGGRQFGLAAETMDGLMALLASGKPARLTAGRVMFDLRKDGLYMVRENRNIETIDLKPGEVAIWDGRFEIANRSDAKLSVVVGVASALEVSHFPSALPAVVVKRMRQAQPLVLRGGEITNAFATDGVSIHAVLAPYDLFLTRFDLRLANALARLMGRRGYPQPPV